MNFIIDDHTTDLQPRNEMMEFRRSRLILNRDADLSRPASFGTDGTIWVATPV